MDVCIKQSTLIEGGVMSDTYLKVILISAVGGLYLIAYSLFYLGTQVYSGEQISIVQHMGEEVEKPIDPFRLLPR